MDFSQWSPSHLLVVAITLLAFGGQLIAILTYLKITAKQHSIENINWKMARASARFFTLPVVCLFAISSVAQANITGGGSLDSTIVPYFLKDIAPILDKQGCSAGMCHGKFGGQGGLNLSLLTLNPELDYEPIVHHNRGRRINLLEPDRSLFFLKPTGQVPHEGGMRFEPNSDVALTILRWIEAGAPFSDDEPRLRKLEIEPSTVVLSDVGETAQLKVLAYFSDDSVADVTEKAVYESKDAPVAEVSPTGEVTSVRWGGTAIIARFLGVVDASFVTIPRASELDNPYGEASKPIISTSEIIGLGSVLVSCNRVTLNQNQQWRKHR